MSPILTTNELLAYIKIKNSALYIILKKDSSFPRPFKLTTKLNAFYKTEVDQWITRRSKIRV